MAWPLTNRIRALVRPILRSRHVERDLDDELESTLDLLIDEKRRAGLGKKAARRAALVELGGIEPVKLGVREARSAWTLELLLVVLRQASRTLRASPGVTAAVVLTLALAIGINTVIFTVVQAVLLRPLPYADPDRLALLSQENERKGLDGMPFPPGLLEVLEREGRTLEVGAFAASSFDLVTRESAVRLNGAQVSRGFFTTLGVHAAHGRVFQPEEYGLRHAGVTILGYDLWQRRFGGDTGILGRRLRLDDRSVTIVGVMPAGFRFPDPESELWIPLERDPDESAWDSWSLLGIVRPHPGMSLDQAQAEVESLTAGLAASLPLDEGWSPRLRPLDEQMTGPVRPVLLTLLAAVGFVLVIACANVSSLLLGQANRRRRELAVRAALGASRGLLARQLLTESLLLSMLGALTGLVLLRFGLGRVVALLPEDFPRLDEIRIDTTVLLFTMGVALLTTGIIGLAPALSAMRVDLREAILGGRCETGMQAWRRFLPREALVFAQLAGCVILLIGASLVARSFLGLALTDPGFHATGVTGVRLSLPPYRYPEPRQQVALMHQLTERLAALHEVDLVGATTGLPTRGTSMIRRGVTVEGGDTGVVQHEQTLGIDAVTPAYFRSLQIPLLAGRAFLATDREGSPPVAIINEELAGRLFPEGPAVGRRILSFGDSWMTVVGVVGNVRQYGLARPPAAQLFLPFFQQPRGSFHLTLRGGDVSAAQIVRVVRELDPVLPVWRVEPLQQAVVGSIAQPRFHTVLMGSFAGLALVLALVGVYGVVSARVDRRRKELGVRMALGARPGTLVRLVVTQGLVPVVLGVVTGIGGAVALTRYLDSLLYGIAVTDPLTFALAPALLLLAATAACLIPARRATRVEPRISLLSE